MDTNTLTDVLTKKQLVNLSLVYSQANSCFGVTQSAFICSILFYFFKNQAFIENEILL